MKYLAILGLILFAAAAVLGAKFTMFHCILVVVLIVALVPVGADKG